MNKKVNELNQQLQAKSQTASPGTRAANPPGASPFEKPNVDPLANNFSDSADLTRITSVKWERLEHDFGRITEGDIVHTTFKFTNTGNAGLYILYAQGSCGCTVPTWPHNLIKPGETAEMSVQFDSHGKKGEIMKTVTVSTNTQPAVTILNIKSVVVPRDK